MLTKPIKLLFSFATVIVSGIGILCFLRRPPIKPETILLGDYAYTIKYAEYRISQAMKQHHLPGAAVALIDNQDVIWQETYGLANIEEEISASPDTIYKMYSIAKVFTALEMMRLVEQGLVNLDDPITDYLPEFSIQKRFPESDPITVRAVLAHHAGLPRNGCQHVSWDTVGDLMDELTASLANCQMTFPVGTHYKYTNIGSNVLAAIIQRIRGTPFPYYMKNDLLAPIGMESSAFLSTNLPPDRNIAMGYEYYDSEYYPIEQGDHPMLASGNLYATLTDMTTFAQFILGDGAANGVQMIEPETLGQMYEDQYSRPQDPQPMGLGWKTAQVLGSERFVWHDGGAYEGVGSLIALLPERKLGVVLFANENSFEGSVTVFLALDILAQMMEAKYGLVSPENHNPEPIEVKPALLQKYEGKYIAWGQALEVFLRGERLKVNFQGFDLNLIPVSQTKFRVDHWLLKLPLEKLFLLPIDIVRLREMEIEFQLGDQVDEDVMMLNFSDIAYEVCPRYPEITSVPAWWEDLVGEYDLLLRLPSGESGNEIFGHDEVQMADNILRIPGVIGPILPIGETEIRILSGPFAGEIMTYEPDSGMLHHQWVVYKRQP